MLLEIIHGQTTGGATFRTKVSYAPLLFRLACTGKVKRINQHVIAVSLRSKKQIGFWLTILLSNRFQQTMTAFIPRYMLHVQWKISKKTATLLLQQILN